MSNSFSTQPFPLNAFSCVSSRQHCQKLANTSWIRTTTWSAPSSNVEEAQSVESRIWTVPWINCLITPRYGHIGSCYVVKRSRRTVHIEVSMFILSFIQRSIFSTSRIFIQNCRRQNDRISSSLSRNYRFRVAPRSTTLNCWFIHFRMTVANHFPREQRSVCCYRVNLVRANIK